MICQDYHCLQYEYQHNLTELFLSSLIYFKYYVNFKGEFQSTTAAKEALCSPASLPTDSESTGLV